jgi:putative FmdB family regulatory protein
MPLYSYRCAPCDSEFEVLESYTDAGENRDCPRCMQNTAERKMALSTFRLYGTGFFKPNKRD